MPDLPHSVHPFPFDYADPAYQSAAREAKSRSRGRCQRCGRELPLEAHHYDRRYPPASQTKAADLAAFCQDCHDDTHDFLFVLEVGGSPAFYRGGVSEFLTILVRPADDGRRVGRAVGFGDDWAALVSGSQRPRVDEVFWLFMRSSREWVTVAVTDVVDGRPGHWRVRTRFLPARDEVRVQLPCVNGGDAATAA